jgi:hypothetical protein
VWILNAKALHAEGVITEESRQIGECVRESKREKYRFYVSMFCPLTLGARRQAGSVLVSSKKKKNTHYTIKLVLTSIACSDGRGKEEGRTAVSMSTPEEVMSRVCSN